MNREELVYGEKNEESNLKKLTQAVVDFRNERGWEKFHTPKDLAISLSLEASELLENFQWKDSEESIQKNYDNIVDELADVMIYSLMLAEKIDIDPEEAIWNKLEKNKEKYPVDRVYGSNKKYTEY